LGLAVLVRLAASLCLPAKPFFGDEKDYLDLARMVRAQSSYPDRPYRPPLYPVVVAAVTGTTDAASVRNVRILQSLLGGVACVLLYALGRRVSGERVAWWAGLLYSVYPLSVSLAVFVFPQAVLMPLTYAACLAALAARDRSSPPIALGAGALLGLAVLCAPSSVAVGAALLVWLRSASSSPAAAKWRMALALLIGASLPVVPWAVRNRLATGETIPVSTNGALNFWLGNNARATLFTKSHLAPEGELARRLQAATPAAADRLLVRDSLAWIAANPARFAWFTALKFLWFFSPVEGQLAESTPKAGMMRMAILASSAPVLLLGLCGLVVFTRRTPDMLLLSACVILTAAFYSLFFPTQRFRAPFDGFLLLFALELLRAAFRQEQRGSWVDRLRMAASHGEQEVDPKGGMGGTGD
jgi:4-amino-4-deoxy-L-arabinose transferase-like glycosyltransferase